MFNAKKNIPMIFLLILWSDWGMADATSSLDRSGDAAFSTAVKKYYSDLQNQSTDSLNSACLNACPRWVGETEYSISVQFQIEQKTASCKCIPLVDEVETEADDLSCIAESPLDAQKDLFCSIDDALSKSRPEPGVCSQESENASFNHVEDEQVDPALVKLLDFKMPYLNRKNFEKDLKDENSILNQFLDLVEDALSDGGKEKLKELKSAVNDRKNPEREIAMKNMEELAREFHRVQTSSKPRNRQQQSEVVSGYLESFFSEDFKPNIKRDCSTSSEGVVIDHTGTEKNMPGFIHIPNFQIKSLESHLGTKFSGKNVNDLSYHEYQEAVAEFDRVTDLNRTAQEEKGYKTLFERNYRDFNTTSGPACGEPEFFGPVNFASEFRDNHYKTKKTDYLSKQTQEISKVLNQGGKVTDLILNSSCSKVPNTPEKYKKDGITSDLSKFKKDILPLLSLSDEWNRWLERLEFEIKNKKDPFSVSFEDLSRMRSLQLVSDLIKSEPRLKDNLLSNGNKITINWEGSSKNGTSGPDWGSRTVRSAYEPHKYVNLEFKTSFPVPDLDRTKHGKSYLATDAVYMKCKDIEVKENDGGKKKRLPPPNLKKRRKKEKINVVLNECPRKFQKMFLKEKKKRDRKMRRRYSRPPGSVRGGIL